MQVNVLIDLYLLWCNGGKSAQITRNYKETSMFLVVLQENTLKHMFACNFSI